MQQDSEDALRQEIENLKSQLAVREAEFEAELHRERSRVLQQVSGGLSHNLNNLLTGILLQAEIIASTTTDGEVLLCLQDIVKTGRRAADLIARLATSVRADAIEPTERIDLNAMIVKAVSNAGGPAKIETELGKISPVRAAPNEIAEALRDLIQNALDAIEPGGKVVVTSRQEGSEVAVEIVDDGRGMDAETLRRSTDPFFTTKKNVGSGLGLSTVRGIVTRADGRLEIASEKDRGTSAILWLPSAD